MPLLCKPEKVGNGLWKCSRCGWGNTRPRDEPFKKNCYLPGTIHWKCPNCELEKDLTTYDFPFICECGLAILSEDPPPEGPGVFIKAAHYLTAVAKWNSAGRPVRSDTEVERIYLEMCRPCSYFSQGTCNHKKCGCQVNKDGKALQNKIRMATEVCPVGKWGSPHPM